MDKRQHAMPAALTAGTAIAGAAQMASMSMFMFETGVNTSILEIGNEYW
ncbi:hypothetical protein [Allopusillimonas ginsengisoli]|nr:hypothetical protein [Allopusillimonas ginsengisoli]